MSYSPHSTFIYTAAFAGAMAGMGFSGRQPTDHDSADYEYSAAVAADFAQEFDTVYASASTSSLDVLFVEEACAGYWRDRQPVSPQQFVPAEFTIACQAILAALVAAQDLFASEGITPPNFGGGSALPSGTLGQQLVLTAEPNTYSAQTINKGPFVTQATWFIDPVSGDDNADGLTSGTAIQTWAELIKRVPGGSRLQQSTTITFLSSQPDDSDPVVVNPAWTIPANTRLIVQGVPTMSAPDTMTVTPIDPATNQPYEIAHTAPALGPAKLLIDSTATAVAWTSDTLSSTDQRMGAFFAPIDPSAASEFLTFVAPQTGDSFVIATLPEIFVSEFGVVGGDSSQVVFFRLNLNGSNSENFASGVGYNLPASSAFAECLLSAFVIQILAPWGASALNCSLGSDDVSGLTLLQGFVFLLGGVAVAGEFAGSGIADFRYMLSTLTAPAIQVQGGQFQPQCLWSFSESWIRHGDGAPVVIAGDFGLSGEVYIAGHTTEFGIALEDGAKVFAFFTDPTTDLANYLLGTSGHDISFGNRDFASTLDVASGRYVNSAPGTTGFTQLKTTIAAGGWEGTCLELLSNSGWFSGNPVFNSTAAPTGTLSTSAAKDADYAVGALDEVVQFDITDDRTCTLPATAIAGRPITVCLGTVGLGKTLTVDGNGENIAGNPTYPMTTAYTSIELMRAVDGSWTILGGKFS